MKKSFPVLFPAGLVQVWLLIFRIAVALFMLTHGWPKFMKLMNGGEIQFSDPFLLGATASLGLAVFAEFFCSIFIGLGLFTRLAAIPLIVTMAVAGFIIHAEDPFAVKEKALLYLACYGTLFIFGGGEIGLGRLLSKKKIFR